MKLAFSQQIFEKYSKVKLHGNPFSGSRVVPCGWTARRTDRHDEGNSHLSKFCNTPKNVTECFMIYSLSSILPLGIEQDINFKLPTGLYPQRLLHWCHKWKTEISILFELFINFFWIWPNSSINAKATYQIVNASFWYTTFIVAERNFKNYR